VENAKKRTKESNTKRDKRRTRARACTCRYNYGKEREIKGESWSSIEPIADLVVCFAWLLNEETHLVEVAVLVLLLQRLLHAALLLRRLQRLPGGTPLGALR